MTMPQYVSLRLPSLKRAFMFARHSPGETCGPVRRRGRSRPCHSRQFPRRRNGAALAAAGQGYQTYMEMARERAADTDLVRRGKLLSLLPVFIFASQMLIYPLLGLHVEPLVLGISCCCRLL